MSTPGPLDGLTPRQVRARAAELRAWPSDATVSQAQRQLSAGVGPERESADANAGLVALGVLMSAAFDDYQDQAQHGVPSATDPLDRLGRRVCGEAEGLLYAELARVVRSRWAGDLR